MISAPQQQAKSGFTLIEALVAVAVVAIAIVGSMAGYKNVSRIEYKSQQSELLQRLAYEKYDEEVSTTQQQLAASSGDFQDRNLTDYSWNLTLDNTSVTDLMLVTVTVTQDSTGNMANSPKGIARGMIYQPQTTGTGAAGAPAGGTGQ